MATPEEIAWAAGLFEGEGCFSTIGRIGIHGRQKARASLGMVDGDTVERFRATLGFGRMSVASKGRGKPLTIWSASNEADFKRTVELFWPWLSTRRKQRAAELLHNAALPKAEPWERARLKLTARQIKLDEERVKAIRATEGSCTELAARFDTSRSNVHVIRTRKTWKHL